MTTLCCTVLPKPSPRTPSPPLPTGGAHLSARRLVVTPSALVERDPDSHDVVCREGLTNVAALVRFAEDPKLLGIEWVDGSGPRQYVTPAREQLLACLLDAAQVGGGLVCV